MPRVKTMPDETVYDHVLDVMADLGSEAVTFAGVGKRAGLSAATLVQRFGSKPAMIHAALLHAWDRLDSRTAELSSVCERTPRGAVNLLYELSGGYGDIERYANRLHVLREDFLHADLRQRGKRWTEALSAVLQDCFASTSAAENDIGPLMVAQWQGALLLWGFGGESTVDEFARRHLENFVRAVLL